MRKIKYTHEQMMWEMEKEDLLKEIQRLKIITLVCWFIASISTTGIIYLLK